jgi:hypothetical protein
MNTSPFGKLNKRDFLNGLVVCVIVSVLTVLRDTFTTHQFQVDWKLTAGSAFTAMLGYLIKNLFSGEVKE